MKPRAGKNSKSNKSRTSNNKSSNNHKLRNGASSTATAAVDSSSMNDDTLSTTTTTTVNAFETTTTTSDEQQEQRAKLIEEATKSSLCIGDTPIDSYIQELFGELVKATRVSNALPQPDIFSYYRASSQQFNDLMSKHAHQLQSSLSTFMSYSGFEELQNDTDDVSHIFETTVDLLDHYYENVDTALDELDNIYSGKQVPSSSFTTSTTSTSATTTTSTTANGENQQVKTSVRPQLKWTDVDNSNKPFVPKIREKPNAFVASLEKSLKSDVEDPPYETDVYFPFQMGVGMGVGGPATRESSYHPYEPELICMSWLPWQTQKPSSPPIMYKGLQNTNCIWVNNTRELYSLAAVLDGQVEFAIDLEQHSYRTFQGFVCLMQISTRDQDYLVDTLELREHLHILNSSFTNPKIVKVMHGSDCDILWLQRDFGLYVVNMFDTGKASHILGLPGLSLAYLLKHYCGVIADKKYQLSDWRIRPLPSEMVKYARQDTHYLLYIYDRLRHDLYDKNPQSGPELLDEVLKLSREICLRRYEKELFTETSYLQVINRLAPRNSLAFGNNGASGATLFSREQELIIRALYKWRDTVARAEDESIRFVLQDHMMITIAEQKPTDVQKLMQICAPVPKLVRRDAKLIVKMIQDALRGVIDNDLITGKKTLDQKMDEESRGVSASVSSNSLEQPRTSTSALLGGFHMSSAAAATMIRTPEVTSRHLKLESPVLSTDQLYQAAGWVEHPEQMNTISKLNFSDDENDSDSDDEDGEAKQRKNGKQNGKRSLDVESDEDITMSERLRTPASNMKRSVLIHGAKSSGLFHRSSLFGDFMDTEDDSSFGSLSNNKAKVIEIKNSFSLEHLASPMKGVTFQTSTTTTTNNTQRRQISFDDKSQEKTREHVEKDDQEEVFKTPAPLIKKDSHLLTADASRQTPPDERVPSSLNEIYKLSHKNRKRNKQKKKLKQDSSDFTSEGQQDQDDNDQSQQARPQTTTKNAKKGNNSRSNSFDNANVTANDEEGGESETKPVDFMKKIGWLGENEDMPDNEDEEEVVEVAANLVIKQPNLGQVQKSRIRSKGYSSKQSNQYNKR